MQKNIWYCPVCGYEQESEFPPKECPQCSSSKSEFLLKSEKIKLEYKDEKLDVVLINGSSHHSHNTGFLVKLAEEELKKQKLKYKIFNLNEFQIYHCWCCYSIEDKACTFPCRNQFDDAPTLHKYLINSKAVIIASPINWNNMSARLKDFIDRLTCIQNQTMIGKKALLANKAVAVIINGHEDGAMKTAWDILFPFHQMGCIIAPYGIAYRTHGSEHNTNTDNNFFKKDQKIKKEIIGIVKNIKEVIKLDLEKKLKDKIIPVAE